MFDHIKNKISEDLYNRLLKRKRKVVEEDKKIRIHLIKKLCKVSTNDDTTCIFQGVEPL